MKPRGRLDFLLLVKLLSLTKLKGSKAEFVEGLETEEHCSVQSRYKFVGKMIEIGVVSICTESVRWGGEDEVVYALNKKRCKEYFKSTEEGSLIYRFIDDNLFLSIE